MLRIERNARSKEIILSMRKRAAPWLSRPLWIALAIALGIHLAAILLFRFPTLKVSNKPSLNSAIVELELTSNLLTTEADWLPSRPPPLLPADLLLTTREYPSPPKGMPDTLTSRSAYSAIHESLPVFRQAERLDLLLKTPPPAETFTAAPQISVRVAGLLAQYPLLTSLPVDPNLPSDLHSCCLRYCVNVDAKTGAVCWLMLQNSAPSAQIQSFAESIVKSMQFALPPQALLPSGEIEIQFKHWGELS